MGCSTCCADHPTTARPALCSSLRYNIKQTYGLEFPAAKPGDLEIPPFYGDEEEQGAEKWLALFQPWAAQEKLNTRKKVQLVHLGLFGGAYAWARELNLERVKWKEFACLFRERFAGDPTPWAGSPKFPYWLYFSGTARPMPGHVQGRAGVGIVIVSPLKELTIAKGSHYLGRGCSIHVAEYTALVMGMETALQRGVRHLTIMCDSQHVFNQVTGKWNSCHSSIRDLKIRVEELLNEFDTCGALYIPKKHNTETQFLAEKAIMSSSDNTPVARRMGFTPISFMALKRRLKQHPLPRDQMKKCCVLSSPFAGSAFSTPKWTHNCQEYARLNSEAIPMSHVSVGTSDHLLDQVSEWTGRVHYGLNILAPELIAVEGSNKLQWRKTRTIVCRRAWPSGWGLGSRTFGRERPALGWCDPFRVFRAGPANSSKRSARGRNRGGCRQWGRRRDCWRCSNLALTLPSRLS